MGGVGLRVHLFVLNRSSTLVPGVDTVTIRVIPAAPSVGYMPAPVAIKTDTFRAALKDSAVDPETMIVEPIPVEGRSVFADITETALRLLSTQYFRTCFVSAPAGITLEVLRESLLARDIRPLTPRELSAGTDWATEVQRELAQADLVIGILPTGQQSAWVLFELGQAWALGRRILVIAPPGSEPIPSTLQRLLVLRVTPNNRQAIDFALDQWLSAPLNLSKKKKKKKRKPKDLKPTGLGAQADSLLTRLDSSLESGEAWEFEKVVSEAIRGSGTDVVVESPERERGADLAIWSDVLEPFVGNPLLVELRLKIQTREAAARVFGQLSSYLGASDTGWALLIYGEGPLQDDHFWGECPPQILLMPARSLFETLRTQTFPEIVRDLRNRRVHSVGS
jgi:hypothetical protein